MTEMAMSLDAVSAGEGMNHDASDPQVAAQDKGVMVTIYGRPFQLSERAARALAWGLVTTLEEIDRNRRC